MLKKNNFLCVSGCQHLAIWNDATYPGSNIVNGKISYVKDEAAAGWKRCSQGQKSGAETWKSTLAGFPSRCSLDTAALNQHEPMENHRGEWNGGGEEREREEQRGGHVTESAFYLVSRVEARVNGDRVKLTQTAFPLKSLGEKMHSCHTFYHKHSFPSCLSMETSWEKWRKIPEISIVQLQDH